MVLRHRDAEVLRFEWLEPDGVRVTPMNEKALRFLPLEMRGEATDERLWAVLRHRIVPKHRNNIQDMLFKLGIPYGVKPLTEFGGHDTFALSELILQNMSADPYISQEEIAQIVGVSLRKIQRLIADLKAEGRLQLVGTGRVKSWKVVCGGGR